MVAIGMCLLWFRCGIEMRMLEGGKSDSRAPRTMAIYTLDGQWKREGSLRKWLVRCLDLVSEDSQHRGLRRDINMLLTSIFAAPVLHRLTNPDIWRDIEMQQCYGQSHQPLVFGSMSNEKHRTRVRKQALHVSKEMFACQQDRIS